MTATGCPCPLRVALILLGCLIPSAAARAQGSLGIPSVPAPILYSEAEIRSAICYAAQLPDVGPPLRSAPTPRVIIDGRIAQAVESTLTHCRSKETPPTWLASVDYLADASAYGSHASHGIVRIESPAFKAFWARYEPRLKTYTASVERLAAAEREHARAQQRYRVMLLILIAGLIAGAAWRAWN